MELQRARAPEVRRSRRARAPLLIGLLLSLVPSCGERRTRPHVVLIVVDTLRADHLSQYGYERDTSPALAALAAQATLFTDCYAPASWTTPSTASLFTGLLPRRHGADFRGAALGLEALTLAEVLDAAGWDTLGISFNHNVTRATRFDQGFRRYQDFQDESKDYPDVAEMLATAEEWLPPEAERPLFLYVQPMNAHGPYRVPPSAAARLLGEPPGEAFRYSKGLMDRIMKDGELQRRAAIDERYLQSHRDQYDTAVRYTLDELGKLLELLERRGLYDDALIILTADHGEELYDHQGFGHGYSLHREVLHVPLLVKLPGQREGRVVAEWTSLLDLFPTVLEAAGLPPPRDCDGRSLLPLLTGNDPAPRPGGFPPFETRWPGRFSGSALVEYPWKLVWVEGNYEGLAERALLFDLAQDPLERNDLAAQHPDVVARLKDALDARRAATPAPLPAGMATPLDESVIQALGY